MTSAGGPLVTVGIPTYNRPASVARVVRSMLEQSYPNIEVIVTDDGDAERTRAALGDELLNRIRYEPNGRRLGIYGNWNRTVELGRGELMAIFHDHDAYDHRIIERCVELFERHPRVGVVHTGVEVVGTDGRKQPVLHADLPEVMAGRDFAEKQVRRWDSYVAHGAMVVRTSLYRQLGAFRPEVGFGADMEMLVRFALHTDIGYVRGFLYQHTGRSPGDAFFDFDWGRLQELMDRRRDNVALVFSERPVQQKLELARYKVEESVRILRELAWLRYHRRAEALVEGLDVAKRRGGPALHAVAAAIASEIMPIGRVRAVRKWFAGQ